MRTRRLVIGGSVAALVAGLGYRAWDRGVFSAGRGPAYGAWTGRRGEGGGEPRNLVRAAILAASAHNTQPWAFGFAPGEITAFAVRARHLGAILVPDRLDMGHAIAAGRSWQRLHLALTAHGLAAQPLNQPVEMVDRAAAAGAADVHAPAMKDLLGAEDWEATFIFRLGHAAAPAPPSPRRAVEDAIIA